MMTALQTIAVAFAMFSALPMPQFDWNAKNMRYALCAFPLVGAVCGALWCLCGMLPLPALDGSKIVLTFVEWIRGKPLNRKVEAIIHTVGLIILFTFTIFVDIFHMIK